MPQSIDTVLIRNAQSNTRFTPAIYGEQASKVNEVLALPLCDSHNELKGVLELVNHASGSFSKVDEERLSLYCRICGIALLSARTLENAQRAQQPTNRSTRRSSMIGEAASQVNMAY